MIAVFIPTDGRRCGSRSRSCSASPELRAAAGCSRRPDHPGVFLLIAIFAPLLAPTASTADRRRRCPFGAQQAPSRRPLVRHHRRRHRRAVPRHLRHPDRARGHPPRGRAVEHRRRPARPACPDTSAAGSTACSCCHGRPLRLPVPAAGDRRVDRPLAAAQWGPRRHHGGGDLDHGRVHPAVLPRDPQREPRGQGRAVRRLGPGRRRPHAAHPGPPHLLQRRPARSRSSARSTRPRRS